MMGIFDGITKKLPPLKDCLNLILDNKQVRLLGSRKEEENFLPWDLLRSGLFYPNRKDIVDTTYFYIEPTCEAVSIFRVEFRDKRKAASNYLSSIGG